MRRRAFVFVAAVTLTVAGACSSDAAKKATPQPTVASTTTSAVATTTTLSNTVATTTTAVANAEGTLDALQYVPKALQGTSLASCAYSDATGAGACAALRTGNDRVARVEQELGALLRGSVALGTNDKVAVGVAVGAVDAPTSAGGDETRTFGDIRAVRTGDRVVAVSPDGQLRLVAVGADPFGAVEAMLAYAGRI